MADPTHSTLDLIDGAATALANELLAELGLSDPHDKLRDAIALSLRLAMTTAVHDPLDSMRKALSDE